MTQTPIYIAAGASSRVSNGATTPGIPAGCLTGDGLYLVDAVVSWDNTPNASSTPPGWTQKFNVRNGGSALIRLGLYYSTYTPAISAPSMAYSGSANDNHYSIIHAVRRAASIDPATDPTDAISAGTSTGNASATAGPVTGITTGPPNSFVLLIDIRDDQLGSSTVASGGIAWTKSPDYSNGTTNGISVITNYGIAPAANTAIPDIILTLTGATDAADFGVMWAIQAAKSDPVNLRDAAVSRASSW